MSVAGAGVPRRTGAEGGRRARVVLLSEQRLVGDAVRTALTSRYLDVIAVDWPDGRRPSPVVRRALAALRPRAGIVFGDLEDPQHRASARMLVATVPLRWVLVVSHHDDASWGDLVAEGATLLPTSISLDDLSVSLAHLMAGADLMPPRQREQMVREWRARQQQADHLAARLARLTPREAEVLDQLARGLSVKEIAFGNGVSEATVRTQVKAVLRKLEVQSQLAAVALVRGW
ncbi:LuxR C-terminal-related transcriptional regulator [Nocardioides sp. C4-1]|uniref:LuxR C-terminal-related transcriptional regulator n=1 Tax=Nocardioides sp. C4-1 TaxID=3151851 RepID=UPI003262F5E6